MASATAGITEQARKGAHAQRIIAQAAPPVEVDRDSDVPGVSVSERKIHVLKNPALETDWSSLLEELEWLAGDSKLLEISASDDPLAAAAHILKSEQTSLSSTGKDAEDSQETTKDDDDSRSSSILGLNLPWFTGGDASTAKEENETDEEHKDKNKKSGPKVDLAAFLTSSESSDAERETGSKRKMMHFYYRGPESSASASASAASSDNDGFVEEDSKFALKARVALAFQARKVVATKDWGEV
ncbi:unnamed protein product, partial [Amoebophrya sp. A25]|eukprot:GSA25T00001718001.1